MAKGYIYIMTNPSYDGLNNGAVVKIGYADDVEKRRKQLSGSGVPMEYRVYATYEVNERLNDTKLHEMIDKLNPELRISETTEKGKKKVREFYYLTPEDAYNILETIATISGTTKRLKKCKITKEQIEEDKEMRAPFKFSMINLKPGEILNLKGHKNVTCTVYDDKRVKYNGEIYSLSSLALKLMKELHNVNWRALSGPLYFEYKGRTLRDIRRELEKK